MLSPTCPMSTGTASPLTPMSMDTPPPRSPIQTLFDEHYPALRSPENTRLISRATLQSFTGASSTIEVVNADGVVKVLINDQARSGSHVRVVPTISSPTPLDEPKLFMTRFITDGALPAIERALENHDRLLPLLPPNTLVEKEELAPCGTYTTQRIYPGDATDLFTRTAISEDAKFKRAIAITKRTLEIVTQLQAHNITHHDLRLENLFHTRLGRLLLSDLSEVAFDSRCDADLYFALINLHRLLTTITPEELTPKERLKYNNLAHLLNQTTKELTALFFEKQVEIGLEMQRDEEVGHSRIYNGNFPYLIASQATENTLDPTHLIAVLKEEREEQTTLDPLPSIEQLYGVPTGTPIAIYATTLPRPPADYRPSLAITHLI